MDRWSVADATAWWVRRPWVCGFNFLPSTAVNFLEMWHPDTFDPVTIERELGWAAGIGFNAVRINLHYLVWRHDRDGLIDRLDRVIGMAHRLGIDTVPCLFDDCGFGGFEPEYGPQPDPVPGVHNSRAVASPGRAMLLDKAAWDGFERYVRDVVRCFRVDDRILFWDLYNEPGNRMIFEAAGAHMHGPEFTAKSRALMLRSFEWSRAESPVQPVTVGAWTTPMPGSDDPPYQTDIDQLALRQSDIVTFHAYWDTDHVRRFIDSLAELGRPMLCTEWMARPVGSRIADQLDLFRQRGVGCFQWGLVQGRTQTHLPWPADLVAEHGGEADRSVWFHDLLDPSGQPYDADEISKIRALTAR
jgi:hypothetical protein